MRMTTGLIALCCAALAASAPAQQKHKPTAKPPVKPPVKNQDISRTQAQMQGGDGVFGTIYTLNSDWNFTILRARYTVEPFLSYQGLLLKPDEKMLVLSVAIKNSLPEDLLFGGLDFQAFDEEGHEYTSSDYRLASLGSKELSLKLKPGQGVGQMPDKDEFSIAFVVPGKAHISKIIMQAGRKFVKGETVVRYFIADIATKERDGQIGNPKNTIAPLPDFVRDPADKTGATALLEPMTKIGTAVPTGYFTLSVDSVMLSSTEKCKDSLPDDGKQFAIVTMTVKNNWSKEITLFELGTSDSTILKDTDGEKYVTRDGAGQRKAKRDEPVPDSFGLKPGETYTFRHFFDVPKDVKLKSMTFGQLSGRKYSLDLTGTK